MNRNENGDTHVLNIASRQDVAAAIPSRSEFGTGRATSTAAVLSQPPPPHEIIPPVSSSLPDPLPSTTSTSTTITAATSSNIPKDPSSLFAVHTASCAAPDTATASHCGTITTLTRTTTSTTGTNSLEESPFVDNGNHCNNDDDNESCRLLSFPIVPLDTTTTTSDCDSSSSNIYCSTTTNSSNSSNSNTTMNFNTYYTRLLSPRSTTTVTAISSSPRRDAQQRASLRCTFCGLGWILCLAFAILLIVPMTYEQYTMEEHTFDVITTKAHSSSISSTHASSSQTQTHPGGTTTVTVVPPTNPYPYWNSSTNDQPQEGTLPEIVWFMSYPGSLGTSQLIQYMEHITQTTTATNYGATLLHHTMNDNTGNDSTTTTLIHPLYPVHPDYQCGPYLHRADLPLPITSKFITTQTYCSTAQTSSSTVVCTECVPKEHKLLAFERACATGNRIYEQHYRSVQYDTNLPRQHVQFIQSPFVTLLNRLRITFQQKIHFAALMEEDDPIHTSSSSQSQSQSQQYHWTDYFVQYVSLSPPFHDCTKTTGTTTSTATHPSTSTTTPPRTQISVLEYCTELDATYHLLKDTTSTTDYVYTLDKYTHVPCHSEIYKYIQWYNDAMELHVKYESTIPIHYIHYEEYISTIRNQTSSGNSDYLQDGVLKDLLEFLNLTTIVERGREDPNWKTNTTLLYDSILYEASLFGSNTRNDRHENDVSKWFSSSFLQSAADMIHDLALPSTWDLIRHYVEPYISSSSRNHFHFRWGKKRRKAAQLLPMSIIHDTRVPDDSIILSPLFVEEKKDALSFYENPFHDYDVSLQPQEPNDPHPEVVWLLSFPNSVRCALNIFGSIISSPTFSLGVI
jgi:hypothetical protein